MRDSAAFQVSNVTCRYGGLEAIRQVSLSLEHGERVAFVGPSGSGKTTLLRMFNTMRFPDQGNVFIFGEEVSGLNIPDLRRLRSRIATIPQDLGLVPNLTVLQNVILGKGGQRGTFSSLRDLVFPQRSDVLTVHEILDRVGIEEKLYARTSHLSGGQQQRVAIARALYQEPEALLADEPVSSVDPARARDTIRLLMDLSEERAFTLAVSLHHIDLAEEFFPRLVGMRSGEVVLDGNPSSLGKEDLENLYRLDESEMMQD